MVRRLVIILFFGAMFGYIAFDVGVRQGLASAPEYVELQTDRDAKSAEDDLQWAEWRTHLPADYAGVCITVFDLVGDMIEAELTAEPDRPDDPLGIRD